MTGKRPQAQTQPAATLVRQAGSGFRDSSFFGCVEVSRCCADPVGRPGSSPSARWPEPTRAVRPVRKAVRWPCAQRFSAITGGPSARGGGEKRPTIGLPNFGSMAPGQDDARPVGGPPPHDAAAAAHPESPRGAGSRGGHGHPHGPTPRVPSCAREVGSLEYRGRDREGPLRATQRSRTGPSFK